MSSILSSQETGVSENSSRKQTLTFGNRVQTLQKARRLQKIISQDLMNRLIWQCDITEDRR